MGLEPRFLQRISTIVERLQLLVISKSTKAVSAGLVAQVKIHSGSQHFKQTH